MHSRLFCTFFIFTLLLSFLACQQKIRLSDLIQKDNYISLSRSYYAVVTPAFLRMRQAPSMSSTGIETLMQYDVVKVSLLKGQQGGWCKVFRLEKDGWLPIDHLSLFETEKQALDYKKTVYYMTQSEKF